MTYELDLANVTIDTVTTAIEVYNQNHQNQFLLSGSGTDSYTLTTGDDDYCSGNLNQVAFFWQGYVSGQMDGDSTVDDDPI